MLLVSLDTSTVCSSVNICSLPLGGLYRTFASDDLLCGGSPPSSIREECHACRFLLQIRQGLSLPKHLQAILALLIRDLDYIFDVSGSNFRAVGEQSTLQHNEPSLRLKRKGATATTVARTSETSPLPHHFVDSNVPAARPGRFCSPPAVVIVEQRWRRR